MAFVPFVETDQPTMAEFNEKFQSVVDYADYSTVKIETGFYIGTGTAGSSNKNSLSFNHKLLAICISKNNAVSGGGELYGGFTWTNGQLIGPGGATKGIFQECTLTWGEKSVSWSAEQATWQLNQNNAKYFYTAYLIPEEQV